MSKIRTKGGNLGLRLAVFIAFSVGGAALAFKLFEPVFVYTSGWAPLPEDTAAPTRQRVYDERYVAQAEAAQAAMTKARADMGAPALSAAVAMDGEVVWASAVGFADIEARRAVDLDSRFRIGSTSKAVTAVAVGTLMDRGLVDLDADIRNYAPHYPKQAHPITLAEVMSHRAGIRDYGLCLCFPVWEHLNRRRFADVNASIGVIANSKLLFEPGTSFAYTSLGYNLAGAAIEGAAQTPFDRYLEEAVFQPLAMTGSGLDSAPGAEASRVAFYEVEKGRYKRAFEVDNSIRWPSGGMVSTPSDLARLGAAMLDDRLLSKQARAALVTVPAGGADAPGAKSYALGWRASQWTLFDGTVSTLAYHHNGAAVGSSSVFVVFPEYRMAISVMMNKGGTNVDDLALAADRIAEAFIGAPAAGE